MDQKYTEILISSESNDTLFEKLENRIIIKFKGEIISKISDLDSTYCDFKVDTNLITLHKQVFLGISIFQTDFNNVSEECNDMIKIIGHDLKSFIR